MSLNTTPGIAAVRGNSRPIYQGVDFTGKAIGEWTVLGPMTCQRVGKTSTYKTKWLCRCSCSSDPKWVNKEGLVRGRSKGCVDCCGTRNSAQNNGNWKGFGELSGEVFNRVRNGARERNLDLEVDLQDLSDLWLLQDRACALTGLPLVLLDSASLDRIDSDLGYITGNIQWVHKYINKMKNDLPEKLFLEMCTAVVKHKSTL